ncbi:unnamed protein product [Clonostachys byssicola]|uniref:Uncharacterized protein n=1 Tax=Clonostachys byssicola TaxID=160290 RepID=A0A9N9UC68_9HYPO|nr:unnamed protein product [Clonostachys byssicola]
MTWIAPLLVGLLTPAVVNSAPTLATPDLSTGDFIYLGNGQYENQTASIMAVDPPKALPLKATANDLRWQPSMDFDTDGCYNVPAIDANGQISAGLPYQWTSLAGDCRDASDLDNNNVYVRQRCNNGWCAYIYDYYFEKDVAVPYIGFLSGHRHDIEHIAVWVKDGAAQYVGASQHGNYEIRAASDVRWDGEHPKMVYHKDGSSTHCFRFATEKDDAIENHKGIWFRGDLVSWNGFPSGIRDTLMNYDFGTANFAIRDAKFSDALTKALPSGITFDVNLDDGSPGNPGFTHVDE